MDLLDQFTPPENLLPCDGDVRYHGVVMGQGQAGDFFLPAHQMYRGSDPHPKNHKVVKNAASSSTSPAVNGAAMPIIGELCTAGSISLNRFRAILMYSDGWPARRGISRKPSASLPWQAEHLVWNLARPASTSAGAGLVRGLASCCE